ncbi:M56 family metallopeptidase [Maribacter sp. IgM3_T14_3]|uniref:M56 family metallopeptidase n=1 Tax=Maribacter sp. IgM3_T14_3 TaxID=3415140 RepID=UPI003C6FDBCB
MSIFLLFYKLLLEKESMHHFKRYFLLTAVIASFIIPQIVFTEYIEIEPTTAVTQVITINEPQNIQPVVQAIEKSPMNWSLILWTIYGLGVAGFALRFFMNLYKIWKRIHNNPKTKHSAIYRILLEEQLPPHTFLKYIFLNKQKFETKSIPNSVMIHEETHALQRHSLDVLFLEVLQVVFWFNPLIYAFKKTIKLNHEFLADSAVLNGQEDHLNYQNTLLSYLSNDSFNTYQSVGIANAINYSSIKKRFIIMKKQTSKKSILLRSLLLLPLLAIMLYSFSNRKEKFVSKHDDYSIGGDWLNEENELETLTITEENENLLWGNNQGLILKFEKIKGQLYYYSELSKEKLLVETTAKEETIQVNGKKFIRKAKSLRDQLNGTWQNEEINTKLIVSEYDIYMVFDLLEGNKKAVRYYPKKRGNSYYFTYGYEDWSFKIENNQLVDSRGNYYNKQEKQQSIKNSNRIIKLAGIVVDSETLEPLANAEIKDSNGISLTTTNNEGYYQLDINNIPEGEIFFTLKIQKEGYKILIQKEHWGNLQGKITSSFYFGLQKNNGATTEFSNLFAMNDNLSYASVIKNKSIIENERLFKSKLEDAKNGNKHCIVEVNKTPYLVDATSWIKLNSINDLIAINDKENIPAFKLNDHINRNSIKAMSPLEDYDDAKFAVYTKSSDINENLDKRAFHKYNSIAKKYNAIPTAKREIPLYDLKILESIYRSMSKTQREQAQPFPECLPKQNQENATKEQISTYNKLAKSYNTMISKGGNIRILKSDVDELTYIYGLMSEKQKVNAEPFPDFPEPPPVPKAPKAPNTADYADAEIERIIATQDTYDGALMLHKSNNLPHNNTAYINVDEELKYEGTISDIEQTTNDVKELELIKETIKSDLNFRAPQDAPKVPEMPKTSNYSNKLKREIIRQEGHLSVDRNLEKKDSNIPPPPPPPTPPSPLDYAISMAKKGATFFYEGKEVSSDKAIDLLKKKKELNIESRAKNGKAEVRITKEPVTIR